MSKSSDAVKKWRVETKTKMIDAFGGKCGVCGYNRCAEALEFHHINPEEKEFGFGKVMANPKSWEKICEELNKCICVCANCHREIHFGLSDIDLSKVERFHGVPTKYKEIEWGGTDICPSCGGPKPEKNMFCSLSCAGKKHRRIDWENIDLSYMLSSGMSYKEIGRKFFVSEFAVRKRAKKLGLI